MPTARGPRTLFLDFDGVLHPSFATDGQLFCRMPLLERALESGFCEIVISSSWRFHHPPDKLRSVFPPHLRGLVVGQTGDAAIGAAFPRYREITAYLEHRPATDWRALDDSRFEFPDPCPRLIFCDPGVGIADPQAAALAAWLRSDRLPYDA